MYVALLKRAAEGRCARSCSNRLQVNSRGRWNLVMRCLILVVGVLLASSQGLSQTNGMIDRVPWLY